MKRRDEVLVGIFLTVAVAIALLGTLWLVRGGLSSGYPLYARFAWGQNLKPGQPVLLAGVNVGAVADVTLRDDALNARNAFVPEKGPEQTQQYAFNLSGTLLKDRTSFSLSAGGASPTIRPTSLPRRLAERSRRRCGGRATGSISPDGWITR